MMRLVSAWALLICLCCLLCMSARAKDSQQPINLKECAVLQSWDQYKSLMVAAGLECSAPLPACSALPGVAECTSSGNVVHMNLYMKDLSGSLPAGWGQMTALVHLHLGRNNLIGTLPAEWGQMASLAELLLYSNNLSGTLPVEWSQMANLSHLNIGSGYVDSNNKFPTTMRLTQQNDNSLSGTLPAEWGKIAKLSKLNLDRNNLSGSLPAGWGQMSALLYLNILGNKLNGTLPAEWGQMSKLSDLILDSNKLSGMLPVEWSQMANMSYLYLAYNELSGTLPVEWGQMVNMSHLQLDSNSLTGTLPSGWGQMVNISDLDLWNNSLTGTFPAEWGQMVKVKAISLPKSICGQKPSTLPSNVLSSLPRCSQTSSANSPRPSSTTPPSPSSRTLSNTLTKSSSNSPIVIGSVVGVLALLAAVAAAAYVLLRHRKHLLPPSLLQVTTSTSGAPASSPFSNLPTVKMAQEKSASPTEDVVNGHSTANSLPAPVASSTRPNTTLSTNLPMPAAAGAADLSFGPPTAASGGSPPLALGVAAPVPVSKGEPGSELAAVAAMLPKCMALARSIITAGEMVVANNARCSQLVSSVSAMHPLLVKLQEVHSGHRQAQLEELRDVLSNIHSVFLDVEQCVKSWCAGSKMGSVAVVLRNMVTASWYQEGFLELSQRLSTAYMGLLVGMNIQDRASRFEAADKAGLEVEAAQNTKRDLQGLVEALTADDGKGGDQLSTLTAEDRQKLAAIFSHHNLDLTTNLRKARSAALERQMQHLMIPRDTVQFNVPIGSGGYGTVYDGTWNTTPVALKQLDVGVLSSRDITDIKREAYIHHRAHNHPNVCQLYGLVLEEPSTVILVLELCSKGNLVDQIYDDTICLTVAQQYTMALDIARGMTHLHDKNIVHGDLKPSNLLVKESGRIAVSDFGLSSIITLTLTSATRTLSKATSSESSGLTLWYSPPELLRNHGSKTAEGDVYAFGVVLLEIFTQKPPYTTAAYDAIHKTVLSGERPDIPGHVPQECEELIRACWNQNPSARPKFQWLASRLAMLLQACGNV